MGHDPDAQPLINATDTHNITKSQKLFNPTGHNKQHFVSTRTRNKSILRQKKRPLNVILDR